MTDTTRTRAPGAPGTAGADPADTTDGPVRRLSRRSVLGGAAIAGAGALASLATSARPAGATTGTLSYGQPNSAGSSTTSLDSSAAWDGANFIPTSGTFVVTNDTGSAIVAGKSAGGTGSAIEAVAQAGTAAISATAVDPVSVAMTAAHLGSGAAISATCNSLSNTGPAVQVESDGGIGIQVTGGPGGAVVATSSGAAPVISATAGSGATGAAMTATSDVGATGMAFVAQVVDTTSSALAARVFHAGKGPGLSIVLTNATNANPVLGGGQYGTGRGMFIHVYNKANTSAAVHGLHDGPGVAVMGQAGTGGVGGYFTGGVANVRLAKSAASSHPTSGTTGDLFVDRSGRLWFCKGAKSWVQLA